MGQPVRRAWCVAALGLLVVFFFLAALLAGARRPHIRAHGGDIGMNQANISVARWTVRKAGGGHGHGQGHGGDGGSGGRGRGTPGQTPPLVNPGGSTGHRPASGCAAATTTGAGRRPSTVVAAVLLLAVAATVPFRT